MRFGKMRLLGVGLFSLFAFHSALAGPTVRYEVKDEKCVGFAGDGQVSESNAPSEKCGVVADYNWRKDASFFPICHGFDAKGNDLGRANEELCTKAHPSVTYKTQNRNCLGFSADGRISELNAPIHKCGTVKSFVWENGLCRALDVDGNAIGRETKDEILCGPTMRYAFEHGDCKGFDAHGRVSERPVNAEKCGKVASYNWSTDDGWFASCQGYDDKGNQMGFADDRLCENANPTTHYKVGDLFCCGYSKDDRLTKNIVSPENCGTVSKYAWNNGSCVAYDANGKKLGGTVGNEELCTQAPDSSVTQAVTIAETKPKDLCSQLDSLRGDVSIKLGKVVAYKELALKGFLTAKNGEQYLEARKNDEFVRTYQKAADDSAKQVRKAMNECKQKKVTFNQTAIESEVFGNKKVEGADGAKRKSAPKAGAHTLH